MNLNQTVTISDQVISQEVSGETVLLDLESESYFGLDEVGTRVWQLLNEDGNLQYVLDTMLEEFEVDKDTLESDLSELLNNLQTAGLIAMTDSQAPTQTEALG